MENQKMIFGEDLFDFVTMSSGKKAGRNHQGIFVTEDPVEQGERLKYVQFFPASTLEQVEFLEKLGI